MLGCRAGLYSRTVRSGRRWLSSFQGLTVLNPSRSIEDYLGDHLARHNIRPASIVLAATPQYAIELPELLLKAERFGGKNLQMIAVSVDAIPPAAQRNGFSAMFLHEPASIDDARELSDGSSTGKTDKNGRSNWTLSSSFFAFDMRRNGDLQTSTVVMPTANTIFHTGAEATMLYRCPNDKLDLSHELLSRLKISLPSSICFSPTIKWSAPMSLIGTGNMEITSAAENMIKSIEGRRAASFLESCKELLNAELSPETCYIAHKVFAQVHSQDGTIDRYEVVAGGGGQWSPRSSMLVLEPRASLSAGDRIEFYLAKPIYNAQSYRQTELPQTVREIESLSQPALVIECAPVIESSSEPDFVVYEPDSVMDNIFGLASEQGFLLDDIKHAVNGELAIVVAR
jgi:hypothetical protein